MFRAIFFSLFLFAVACTGSTVLPPGPALDPLASWPPSPAKTRIVLMRTFSTPDDLGIERSFARRLWGAVVGDPDQRLVRPYSVDVDGQLIVVSDPGTNAVHIYDLQKSRYRRISTFDDRHLQTPVGVAIAAENIIVADSSLGSVLVFNDEGQLLREFKGLQRPTGLAWHEESGLLYVADTLAHEVVVFDKDGNRAFSFGNRGTEPGQLNYPTHLNLDKAKLWINDSMNFRIQAFGLDGEHLAMFGEHGDGSGFLSQPKGVGVDSGGHVYVAGATIDRVQIFSHDGRFLLSFGQPGNSPGSFTMPAGVAIENDLIYVADSYNSRVQVFRYLGED